MKKILVLLILLTLSIVGKSSPYDSTYKIQQRIIAVEQECRDLDQPSNILRSEIISTDTSSIYLECIYNKKSQVVRKSVTTQKYTNKGREVCSVSYFFKLDGNLLKVLYYHTIDNMTVEYYNLYFFIDVNHPLYTSNDKMVVLHGYPVQLFYNDLYENLLLFDYYLPPY